MQTKNIAYQVEGLDRHPGIGMKLGKSHVERLKGAHHEVIEW